MIRIGFIRSKVCSAKYVPQDKRRVLWRKIRKKKSR